MVLEIYNEYIPNFIHMQSRIFDFTYPFIYIHVINIRISNLDVKKFTVIKTLSQPPFRSCFSFAITKRNDN